MSMAMTPRMLVEAALFTAGRPLSLDEIQKATKLKSSEIINILNEIKKDLEERLQALELTEVDGMYVIRVRPELSDVARKISTGRSLGKGALKTLAFIAKNQPVLAKDVAAVRGSSAYSHIKRLERLGLIRKRPDDGKYETTKYFYVLFNADRTGAAST